MSKKEAIEIHDATKKEIEKRKKELSLKNYSPEKRIKIEEAIREAEESLEELQKFINSPFNL